MTLPEEIFETRFQDAREAAFELALVLEAALEGNDGYTTLKALSVVLATKLAYFAEPENFDELIEVYLRVQRKDIKDTKKMFTP